MVNYLTWIICFINWPIRMDLKNQYLLNTRLINIKKGHLYLRLFASSCLLFVLPFIFFGHLSLLEFFVRTDKCLEIFGRVAYCLWRFSENFHGSLTEICRFLLVFIQMRYLRGFQHCWRKIKTLLLGQDNRGDLEKYASYAAPMEFHSFMWSLEFVVLEFRWIFWQVHHEGELSVDIVASMYRHAECVEFLALLERTRREGARLHEFISTWWNSTTSRVVLGDSCEHSVEPKKRGRKK